MEYEIIICFETHVELKTATKLFCGCEVSFGAAQNSHICPVCTGQPGTLPVLNQKAVEYCVEAGLALNSRINPKATFARKNYFYPDLPKGYQISQYETPFCEDGNLNILGDDGHPYEVGIKRIHLEEDAGKLIHSGANFDESEYSLVDFNRAGVPLIEIVGDHERNPLRSVNEARQYLEKLRQILRYAEVSDCIIEKGQFRSDVNISLCDKDLKSFGNRSEIKNMSSFKFICEALEYEIKRQAEILRAGNQVVQETRLFDEVRKITLPMRRKEDAPDYRYFPDPDLLEMELKTEFIENIKKKLPLFPDERVKQLVEEYNIPQNDAYLLTKEKSVADYFSAAIPKCENGKKLLRWIVVDLQKVLHESDHSMEDCPVEPEQFAELINLISQGDITETIGKKVLDKMLKTGKNAKVIVEEEGLKPIQDEKLLENLLRNVFKENPQYRDDMMAGNTKIVNFVIGRVMAETKGKANPKKVQELLNKKFLD
jgi:aspartyl-tRNA(Asn)/glutamyl-tRNA(Gln) amidotransferase subunit B